MLINCKRCARRVVWREFLKEASDREAAWTGGRYLGCELDGLGQGELRWRRWDRDTLGVLILCALSLSLRLHLLPCLSRLLLLLLLGLLICRRSCLSLLIGLSGCVSGVSCVGCVGLLHGGGQELRLSLL